MSWIFFALISILSLSIANLLQRVLMKNEDSEIFSYSIVFQITCALIVGAFAFIKGFSLPPIFQLPWNFLFMTVLYGTGTLLLFKALQSLEASETTILTSVRSLVTVVSAVVLLREAYSLKEAVGTLLILLSIFLISQVKKLSFKKGSIYAFGFALCFGLAVTNDVFILKRADAVSYATIGFLLPGIFLILVNPKSLKRLNRFFDIHILSKMFLMCLFYSIAAIAFYTAVTSGAKASQIGPINQSSIIVTVLLAAIFLSEKDNLFKKIIAAVLVTIGVILLG